MVISRCAACSTAATSRSTSPASVTAPARQGLAGGCSGSRANADAMRSTTVAVAVTRSRTLMPHSFCRSTMKSSAAYWLRPVRSTAPFQTAAYSSKRSPMSSKAALARSYGSSVIAAPIDRCERAHQIQDEIDLLLEQRGQVLEEVGVVADHVLRAELGLRLGAGVPALADRCPDVEDADRDRLRAPSQVHRFGTVHIVASDL